MEEMTRPAEEKHSANKTGWLPGPLSYPWIFIAVGISELVSPYYF